MARAEHERAIGAAAVSAAAREQMRAEAGELEARKDSLRDCEKAAEELAGELDQAREERAALPPGNVDGGMPCPHCGAFVVLRRINVAESRLEKAETVHAGRTQSAAPGDRRRRRQGFAPAGSGSAANHSVEMRGPVCRWRAEASNRLAQMPPASTDANSADATQNALVTAEARLLAWRRKNEADYLHVQISGNERLLDILAADGLRAQKLARGARAL